MSDVSMEIAFTSDGIDYALKSLPRPNILMG